MSKQIVEEAAAWFVEFSTDDPDLATRRRFDAWLCQSPEHVRAYLGMLPIWDGDCPLDMAGDPDKLVQWARAANNVVQLETPRSGHADELAGSERFSGALGGAAPDRRRARLIRPLTAVAASIAVVCITAALSWSVIGRSTYETALGEQRVIALDDGSTVKLNSRSKIRIRFTGDERTIVLVDGQALFQVAKDSQRPFVVRSDDVRVRAVGTEFDVYRKAAGTTVTVVEGKVAVSGGTSDTDQDPLEQVLVTPVAVSAGEQLVVSTAVPPVPRRVVVDTATAWTQQRLVFSNTPLTAVVDEFNRYNKRKLVIAAGAPADFNVTGAFSSTNPLGLVRFLQAQPGLRVVESTDRILVASQ